MNTENGSLSFDAVINNEKLIGSVNEMEKRIKGFSDSTVKEGDKIDDAFKITAENIKIQNDVIAKLESELKTLNAEIDKVAPGNGQLELKKQAAQVAAELKAEKDALVMLEAEVKKTEQSHVSFRTQLRNAREELIRMEQAGLRGTDAYRELQQRVGELTDAMSDAQAQANVLANDEKGFQGVVSMVSGFTGAMSAAQGAVGLFAGENENLNKIMLKVQSLMAITIGLQQVAEMLNKDSYFSIVILTKAKELFAVAEMKVATAMGVSTAAARVLMATLTLGLSVAITGIIVLLSKLSSQTAENRKKQQEFNKAVAEAAFEPVSAMKQLSTEWNSLGNNMAAKEKLVKDNAEQFDKLGISINNVNDAERVLSDPKTLAKLQTAFMMRARAMAAVELAQKKYQEVLEKQEQLNSIPETVTMRQPAVYGTNTVGQEFTVKNRKHVKLKEETDKLEKEVDNYFKISADFKVKEAEILSDLNLSSEKNIEGSIRSVEETLNQLREKYREATTDPERNKLLKQIQEQEKLLEKLDKTRQQKAPKAQKEAKVKVIDIEEDAEVTEDATVKLYNELVVLYRNYEQKRIAIGQEFDEKRAAATVMNNQTLLEELNKAEKKALNDLAREVLDENGVGLVDLYIAGNGTQFIQDKIKEAMPLFDNLAGLTHTELQKLKVIIDDIGFSPEQIKLFEQAGVDVEKLVEALKKAKEASKDAVSAQDWENVLKTAQQLSGSVAELGNSLQEFGGGVAEIGKGLVAMAGQVDNLTTAFSKTASTEDKISAGISALSSLISMDANQIAANKKAQEEWNAKIAQGKHEMAMLRIEAEAYEQSNIFGVENPYSRAIAGAKQYAQATKELYDAQRAVEGGQVQTGTKKVVSGSNVMSGAAAGAVLGTFIPGVGNLVGAGIGALVGGIVGLVSRKTVPVFENLKKKYGEVFDANGELNKAIIADYDKMDEGTKKLIDNWEEIKAKQEEAKQQMQDNFRDLAGDLGTSLSDALVEAFSNGNLYSAIDKFDAKMNDVISNIVSQLIFSSIFGQMFDDLKARFNESFGENGDQNLVDDLTDFGSTYKDNLAAYNEAMRLANEEMKRSGLAGFTGSAASKTGLSGAIQNVTEETASVISGQLNAIRIHQIESVDVMRNQLMALNNIATNTAYNANLVKLNDILSVLKTIASGDGLRAVGL